MSRLKRVTPCHACPYRKGATPGWLGSDRPVPFVAKTYVGEATMPCHTEIDYSDPDWLATQEPEASLCAGALIMLRNDGKLPRDPEMSDAVRAVAQSDKVFRDPAEFLNHHQPLTGGPEWTRRMAQGAMDQWSMEQALIDELGE